MRLHPEVDLADPFWREQMFFSRLPAALSAVFQEDDLAECREQIEAQTSQLVPCKRARVILASGGRGEPRRKSGVARLSVPLFAHGRVLGTLALDRRERWSSPRERELVRSFAELASQALYALTVRCELFDLARTDPLTGVGNRRRLIEDLVRLTETATPFRMLFVDVDGLKAVNDKLGFERGDQLIVALANALNSTIKPGELVARLGGDEFVVVLPRLSKKQARKRAKRLEEEIDRLAVSRRVRRHFHGASTGIVKARKNDSAAKVLGRGEQAMRAEKQRRRKQAEENGNGSSGRPQSRVVR
ncbi:MAG TPA: sensor domain-containing diguanylate cyclase [Gaiellales bacterium]|nr:sensor domain-containing diguanylate cyclase [Gaiellales bacterium]